MIDTMTHDWTEANRRQLMAALADMRARFERYAGDAASAGAAADVHEAEPGSPATALDVLCASFGLSPFERQILLLCAGVELDESFARLVASIQSPTAAPTFGLALAVLPDAHWSALSPGSPLRRWRLVEVGASERLVSAPLRVDERVLHYLTGLSTPDEHLAGFVRPVTAERQLSDSQSALAEAIATAWKGGSSPLPIVQLVAGGASDTRSIAAAAALRLGLRLHAMPAHAVPHAVSDRESLMRLWEREAILSGSALLVEADDVASAEPTGVGDLRDFLEQTHGAIAVSMHEPIALPERATATFDVRKPTTAEQRALWSGFLAEHGVGLNGEIDQLVQNFDLDAQAIRDASQQAVGSGTDDAGSRLWENARRRVRPQLDGLARSIEPAAGWDDLVLPDLQMQMLHDIATQVRNRLTVYERWGFATRSSRGLGVSALFAGPSGTGKTLAAEVLANELQLDLYHIDLSRVVSKYIGETEKNLSRVFDAAEAGGAILLFDEADALFGKRTEVKDSHDRYANLEVSYLLQRMESYRGLAILTTNMKGSLDDAFIRRLRFIITFPFPDAGQRAEIWRRIFPAKTPTEELDPRKLARLNVAGGNIRNIALAAAFLAAEDGSAVQMHHLLRAARGEYAKMDRSITEAETRGWI